MAPEPVLKGIYQDIQTGKDYWVYFLKHNPDAGEAPQDDCMLTVSVLLTGGEHNCGDSGLFPIMDFANRFRFIGYPKPGKKFGQS